MAINHAIFRPEVQEYLQTQENTNAASIALRKSPFSDILPAELAQQVEGRQRIRKKLPEWYHTLGIYYPPRVNIEQASSALTAKYKGTLIPARSRIIDLTGGFGVDSFYLSQQAATLTYCEQNTALAAIVQHNFNTLQADNIRGEVTNGVSFLTAQPDGAFDSVYIDPSRRKNKKKVFLLSDCEPDIVAVQQLLLKKAQRVYIKAAPLLDISETLRLLQNVHEIYIISVENECKELLVVLQNSPCMEPTLIAAALDRGGSVQTFQFTPTEEREAVPAFALPEAYLYEPDAALLKAGAFKCIAQRFNLKKLHPHTHLYTSGHEARHFIGRVFRIMQVIPYATFKKDYDGIQANCNTRNFPLDVVKLQKKHHIRDGGDLFLFFCKGPASELLVIFTSKS